MNKYSRFFLVGLVLAAGGIAAAETTNATGNEFSLGPAPEGYPYDRGEIKLSEKFKRVAAPGTGRRAVQLTAGKGDNYPLYYFIPSLTKDLRYLVYHSTSSGTIQACRLDLHTGESAQLTKGDTKQKGWWGSTAGTGILDQRTVLNVARGQVIYFTGPDGRQARMVDLATLRDTLLFELPEGRAAIAQNACTPDGKWFLYIHAPANQKGNPVTGEAHVMAYNFDTAEQRVLHKGSNGTYHHIIPYGNDRALFCHPWSMVGFDGQPAVTVPSGCHSMVTSRGISCDGSALHHPLTGKRVSIAGGKGWGYTHTGWDPEGRFWFWEVGGGGHRLVYLKRYDKTGKGQHEFADLTGEWRNSAGGQRGHFHPQLTPDRKWVLFAADEVDASPKSSETHVFLLDVSDLTGTDLVGDAVRKNPGLVRTESRKGK
jgi:hypothetical protein